MKFLLFFSFNHRHYFLWYWYFRHKIFYENQTLWTFLLLWDSSDFIWNSFYSIFIITHIILYCTDISDIKYCMKTKLCELFYCIEIHQILYEFLLFYIIITHIILYCTDISDIKYCMKTKLCQLFISSRYPRVELVHTLLYISLVYSLFYLPYPHRHDI